MSVCLMGGILNSLQYVVISCGFTRVIKEAVASCNLLCKRVSRTEVIKSASGKLLLYWPDFNSSSYTVTFSNGFEMSFQWYSGSLLPFWPKPSYVDVNVCFFIAVLPSCLETLPEEESLTDASQRFAPSCQGCISVPFQLHVSGQFNLFTLKEARGAGLCQPSLKKAT